MNLTQYHRRNLFEVDNARNLSMRELVDTFIPTEVFWRLLSAKHHVVFGARGQGKTALAKMISHDHLALLAHTRNEPRAKSAIRDQAFIGIYIPTRLEWVGGLSNKPWMSERECEELFQWRLNIASCIAFIPAALSCISEYLQGNPKQAQAERELARQLSEDWVWEPQHRFQDLMQLRQHLENTDYRKQVQILRGRAAGGLPAGEKPEGLAFGTELFSPLHQAIRRLSRLLNIASDCRWLLCIDEAEFLEKRHHRIINSHIRAYPDNLFIKLTTMPYCHYTLGTNIGADLVNGHDFEYVNMESDRVLTAHTPSETDTIGTNFGRTLFAKLLQVSEPFVPWLKEESLPNLMEVLGETPILDPRHESWDAKSDSMKLLRKYGSKRTIERACRLIGKPEFRDQVGRKIHGALLLRKEFEELKGNKAPASYCGARMVIRCADGNPRRLIRIFNALLMLRSSKQKHFASRIGKRRAWISAKDQTRALRSFAATTLNQVMSSPKVGPDLYDFLCTLGNFMHGTLHERPLSTDQISSVVIDSTISDQEWKLVQVAVGQGLLYPNIGSANPDELPWREGAFHLAYVLAPHFFIVPRRAKAVSLKAIRMFRAMTADEKDAFMKYEYEQLQLFDEGDAT